MQFQAGQLENIGRLAFETGTALFVRDLSEEK